MNESVDPQCDPPGRSRAGDVVDDWHADIHGSVTALYAIRRGAASNERRTCGLSAVRYARRTARLERLLGRLALAMSAEAASRIARALGIPAARIPRGAS